MRLFIYRLGYALKDSSVVHPSVRPSVRPSVCLFTQLHPQCNYPVGLITSFFDFIVVVVVYSYDLPKQCVKLTKRCWEQPSYSLTEHIQTHTHARTHTLTHTHARARTDDHQLVESPLELSLIDIHLLHARYKMVFDPHEAVYRQSSQSKALSSRIRQDKINRLTPYWSRQCLQDNSNGLSNYRQQMAQQIADVFSTSVHSS